MFSILPNKLVTYVFEFLGLRDYSSVLCVSKQFFSIINDHNKFWTRECFRQYISFDLEPYSEIYNDEEYKNNIKHRTFALPKGAWKKLLEEGIKHRQAFGAILKQITPKDKVENFLAAFDQVLKQPPAPMATLKRETIVSNTQTLFQSKLSEVLYEGSVYMGQKATFVDGSKALIDELKDREKELLEQMSCDPRNEILKARWYLLDQKKNTQGKDNSMFNVDMIPSFEKFSKFQDELILSSNDKMNVENNKSLLLTLYQCLCNIVSHFCGVMAEYLDSIENVYDLLAEYSSRWNTFINTIIELERIFETFTELMNNNYEAIFEGYPSYPKFSIWRLMSKIWMKEVFEKSNFKLVLNESFLRVLSNHREKNIKKALNNNSISLDFSNNLDKYSELPKSLYVGLGIRRKKNSSMKYQSYDKLNNTPHACFQDVMDLEKRLLSNFIQSILDISLNEVKIHYLNCSDIPTNYPYRELEECFLMKSSEFYSDYQNLFHESPDYFCHFLKSDCTLLSEILNERTNIKLETIQIQNALGFMKNFIYVQLLKIKKDDFENMTKHVSLLDSHHDTLGEFIEGIAEEVLGEANREEDKEKDFYDLPVIEIDEENEELNSPNPKEVPGIMSLWLQSNGSKNFIKKLVAYLEATHADFRSNFAYLKQRLEHFEQVKEKDAFIKEDNIKKNIPYEIGDVDSLFYDLDKNIDLSLLDKLYEDYKAYEKQQEKECLEHRESMDEEPYDRDQHQIDQNNNQFEGVMFDDFQDLDLMQLPNLSMRRVEP